MKFFIVLVAALAVAAAAPAPAYQQTISSQSWSGQNAGAAPAVHNAAGFSGFNQGAFGAAATGNLAANPAFTTITSRKTTTFGSTSGQNLFSASGASGQNHGASSFSQNDDLRAGRKLGINSELATVRMSGAHHQQQSKQGLVAIEAMDFDMPAPGVYQYHYKTADGIEANQEAQMKAEDSEAVHGTFAWVAPDGQKFAVEYVADETGYHPSGAHLPQIPAAIARSLEWNAQHPEEDEQAGLKPGMVNYGNQF